jgi:hypothetical protein
VRIEYAGFQVVAPFDLKGRMDYVLDCFAGDKSAVAVVFPNGERDEKPVVTRDLDQISKVAVVWRGEVNLDLHAFEYAAGAMPACGRARRRTCATPRPSSGRTAGGTASSAP